MKHWLSVKHGYPLENDNGEKIEKTDNTENRRLREQNQQLRDVMERMEIAHRADHMPAQLSGGQQQRVAVARAVIAEPNLILADEPTGNLDSHNGQEVMELLTQLNQQGTTILMVTHSPAHAEYARRDISLFDGEVMTENLRRL